MKTSSFYRNIFSQKKIKQKGFISTSIDEINLNDLVPSQEQNLGIFVAKKVSKYHGGRLSFEDFNNLNIEFKLFIPSILVTYL